MIRFIIKRRQRWRDERETFQDWETLDLDIPELERILRQGGYGIDAYDRYDVEGVTVLDSENNNSSEEKEDK